MPLVRKEPFTSSFCEEWIRSTPQDRSQRYIFLGSNPSNPGYLKIDYYFKKKSVCIHEKSSNVYQIYLKWREFESFENKNSSRLPLFYHSLLLVWYLRRVVSKGEGVGGALHWKELIKLCKEVGFSGPYLVTARPFVVEPHLRQPLGRCLNCVVKLLKYVTTKNCTLVLFFQS